MNSPLRIQAAAAIDIPHLNQLVNSAYRGDASRRGWTTEAELLDGIRVDEQGLAEMLADPAVTILKAENEEGRLLGCVYLKKQDAKLYLGMLSVAPDQQDRGLGKQLLAASEDHARALHCTALTITVISVRAELIAWYQRHGYAPTGATEPFPNDPRFGIPRQPLRFIVMEKSLR
ncbi:GNAT family N-acetyltransferase [Hymenobacter sp. BT175]|uniref:GNAT family N-acetyltransferase n=1 Tax=Hymenobacter translucens TaxID=2886507 RepID=UPI001D0E5C85|nr:GNAT family N-acetyltransferase [Hymenobacter translucens]MCC2547142.1 GNAT family N-acetyltransferase [Hymenobacter translucens]